MFIWVYTALNFFEHKRNTTLFKLINCKKYQFEIFNIFIWHNLQHILFKICLECLFIIIYVYHAHAHVVLLHYTRIDDKCLCYIKMGVWGSE